MTIPGERDALRASRPSGTVNTSIAAELRSEYERDVDRLRPVARLRDHPDVGREREQATNALPHEGLIVRDEHPDLVRHTSDCAGQPSATGSSLRRMPAANIVLAADEGYAGRTLASAASPTREENR